MVKDVQTDEPLSLSAEAAHIRSLFNQIAPVYDQLNDWLSLGLHRVWKQMAVQWADPQPGDTCLDLCCGSGDLARRLARTVGSAGHVYGADFSPAQLAIAAQLAEASTLPLPITWVEADALNLPFDDNFFDAATMGYGLRNVTDIPRCLQELHRVLKSGAAIAILDFHRPSTTTMQQFQQWYLDQIVVPISAQFQLKEEYAYISPSLECFPRGQEQVHLAQQAGFTTATHYPILGGMMGVLVAQK